MSTKLSMPRYEERFIARPNLPDGRVLSVALGSGAGEAAEKLRSLGINTWMISPDTRLPEPINAMQIFSCCTSAEITLSAIRDFLPQGSGG